MSTRTLVTLATLAALVGLSAGVAAIVVVNTPTVVTITPATVPSNQVPDSFWRITPAPLGPVAN